MTSLVVPELLAERARTHSDRLFVESAGESRSFAEMHERAQRVAAGLATLGVRPGDRVASILLNRIEHVDLIFACAVLGAIHVPVNVFLKGDFLSYQLEDAGASVVVADDEGIARLDPLRPRLPELRHVLHCRDLPEGDDVPAVALGPADTLAIVYTSGTTGMPKGCMLPHGYHVRSAEASRAMLGYRAGDVVYTANPLFHGWARGMVFAALVHRMRAVVDPDFSASTALARWAQTGATVFSGVGAMGVALLATPPSEADRAHRLRVAFMIPFAPHLQKAFEERFGVRVQSQMYGQTETGAITFSRLKERGKPASVGRRSPMYEIRVVDDRDQDVAAGAVGEIIVRPREPDVLYTGYWRKDEDTAAAMRGGWHHTGDLGRLDKAGFLTFVDRKKDAVRRRGENVSSVQLEAAITAHPDISEAAIIAVPSKMTEDEIKTCLVLREGASLSPEELFAFFKQELPYFAIPRYVEIVDSLPKTATMRVQKHILRLTSITPATWDFEDLGLVVSREERRR